MPGRVDRHKVALPDAEQRTLDELVVRRGWEPTAKILRLTESVVNQLAFGGRAMPATVARVAEALREHAQRSA